MKGSSSSSAARSESEREKTKMRERQRRAITGKIFHGLRKHGGYRLSPRADINEVLRHLAAESGWTVHSDGTTFRSSSVGNCCPVCGAVRPGGGSTPTPTPTSSTVIHGGGECSTTASPRHLNASSALDPVAECEIPMSFYGAYGGPGGIQQQQYENYSGGFVAGGVTPVMFQPQQVHEAARASNQSTPAGSC